MYYNHDYVLILTLHACVCTAAVQCTIISNANLIVDPACTSFKFCLKTTHACILL